MKKLAMALGLVVVLLVVGVVLVAWQAGSIIKSAVEEFGPQITGVPVTVDNVDLSVLSGRAHVEGLVIGSPDGFRAPETARVGEVEVLLDVKSLFSDRIYIQKILIDGTEMTYELGKGESNVDALLRNIKQQTERFSSGKGDSQAQETAETKLIIDDIFVNGTRVNLAASMLGGGGTGTTIPDIHLSDIGKDDGGATAAEVVKKLFSEITRYAVKAGATLLSSDQLKEGLDSVNDKVKGVGDKLKGLIPK